MKFFIFMYCTAHLLTGISSRLRRTTPMSLALRSEDADERQVAKFAEMIDFVNSAPNNVRRRNYFRRHGRSKRQDSRRLNEVMAALYGFAKLTEKENVDNINTRRNIKEKVRHSKDVFMKHRGWQKKYTEKIQEDTPFDELKYSTAENKWDAFRVATTTSVDNSTVHVKQRTQDNAQELTTNKNTNRKSFRNDDDDEKLGNNEKQNIEPKTKEDHAASPIIVRKKKQHNKPSSKEDEAQIDKKKADKHNSKETDTKKEDNKENKLTKFIYSQEKLNEDEIRPKDEPDEKINREDGDTNENGGKGKNQIDTSWDISNFTSPERLILKRDNSLHNNRDRMEQFSIYSLSGISETSNKQSKKSRKKIEKNNKMIKEKLRDIRGERKNQWFIVDTENDYENEEKMSKKERDWDTNHDELSGKEKDLDNNDRWNNKEKDWDYDGAWNKTEKYGDNDDTLNKKEKYWNNQKRDLDKDKGSDPMEFEWNKRHENDAQLDHNDHETNKKRFKEIDNYYMKRDSKFHKRDNEWTKWDAKVNDRNESGNKKSFEGVDQKREVRHDRYKIVDRADSVNSRDNDRL